MRWKMLDHKVQGSVAISSEESVRVSCPVEQWPSYVVEILLEIEAFTT